MSRCPEPWTYSGDNPGPCGPTRCNGECDPEIGGPFRVDWSAR